MQVKIDVSFPSGAKVELSKSDVQKVTQFIHQMFFATPVTEKRKYTKRKKYQAWTEEELERAKNISQLNSTGERIRAMKALASESGHTYGAVYSKVHRQKKDFNFFPSVDEMLR